jgi:hypothetical protein
MRGFDNEMVSMIAYCLGKFDTLTQDQVPLLSESADLHQVTVDLGNLVSPLAKTTDRRGDCEKF